MRQPAVPIVCSLLAGCVAGLGAAPPREAAAAAVCLSCLGAAASFRCGRPAVSAAAVCLAFATAGAAIASSAHDRALHPGLRASVAECLGADVGDAPSPPVWLVGRLAEDGAWTAAGGRLVVDVATVSCGGEARRARGRVVLGVAGTDGLDAVARWRSGRTVRVPALLRRQARYYNPGVPDFERASLRRGIALVGSVKSPRLVEVVAHGGWAHEAAASVRAWVRRVADRDVGRHSTRSAAIVRAVLIGDRNDLDDETEERMQAAGSYHVLAISGGNIAILAGLLVGVLRAVRCGSPVREAVASGLLAAYAWLVGGGPSVVRATTMAVAVLGAGAFTHRGDAVNGLAGALGLGLAVSPLLLFDPGAWLTYGATAALIVSSRMAEPALGRLAWPLRAAATVVLASIAAELALFPVGALVFSRVTAAGILVNLAAVPLMVCVQVGAMVLLGVSALPQPAGLAGVAVHHAAWALVECGRVVDVWPWLARRLPPPHVAVVVAYYLAGCGALLAWRLGGVSWRRTGRAAVVIAGLAAGWMVAAPRTPSSWPEQGPRVTVLDVGQGDATLVQLPGGRSALVDAGGAGGSEFDIGGRVIAPALWELGVRRLDWLVVTHGDADHANGAAHVIRDFRPAEIWEGVPVRAHPLLAAIRDAAAGSDAVWRQVVRGDRVEVGPAVLDVRHPAEPDWERQRVRNDDSVVVDVRVGRTSMLLAGDIEAGGEGTVAPVLAPAARRVLLAPHHGSATSLGDTLLESARPAAVVISAGRGNRYGHPHRAVLERLTRAGVPVYRTDRDGAVTVDLDGGNVRIRTRGVPRTP